MDNQLLLDLYTSFTGAAPKSVESITGSGSNRKYVRFTSSEGKSIIGVIGTSLEENYAFIYLARHFQEKSLPVPRVLAVSDDERCYLQEDLGTCSLFDALRSAREAGGRYGEVEKQLLRRTIAQLPRLQIIGAEGLDFSVCYPQPELDETNIFFDLNYFKYCFLKATGVDFHEVRLEQDFRLLAHDLLMDREASTFLYRDFQARNVMLDASGNPRFIDFQGGRRGPVYYDLASFLWQASARYPQRLRDELIDVYCENLEETIHSAQFHVPDIKFSRSRLDLFVLFRLLQVLGAYGFRGYFERKQHFLDSIPPALENLRELLAEEDSCPYPELRKTLEKLVDVMAPSLSKRIGGEPLPLLTVRIFSFSYKRGIPEDTSGNGGGYVFDCRSTHNPGRYEPYKQLTGLDAPVIKFLEDDGEIQTFLDSVYRLADAHVERYIQRGFTDLMFSFGCTGGQHRSVYCAQHLAEHLHEKYGIRIDLTHREQGIHTLFSAQ